MLSEHIGTPSPVREEVIAEARRAGSAEAVITCDAALRGDDLSTPGAANAHVGMWGRPSSCTPSSVEASCNYIDATCLWSRCKSVGNAGKCK